MSNAASKRFVLACSLAVLAIFLVFQFLLYRPTVGTTVAGAGTLAAGVGGSSAPFTIDGATTQPISPGVRTPLDLRLTNPHASPLTVTGLSVTVQKVTAPNADVTHPCVVADFVVDQTSSTRNITVAARATSTLTELGLTPATMPQVGMLNRSVNQDGCKGASLTLAFTAYGSLEE